MNPLRPGTKILIACLTALMCSSASAERIGSTYGQTWPIAEPDMVEQIKDLIKRKRSTNPILPRARYAVINCSALRFQGRRASKCSTVVAAGKARSTWRSHRYGSKPLALAVSTSE